MERPSCNISCASFIDHIMSSKLCLPLLKVYLGKQSPSSHITKSLSLLEAQHEEYAQGVSNSSSFTDHISSLKLGLQFLATFLDASINDGLKVRIKRVVYEVSVELHSLSNRPIDGSLILDLNHAYTDLREKVKNVIINPSTGEYDVIFRWNGGYWMALLRIFEDLSHCKSHVSAPLKKEIEDIKENLMPLQALLKFVMSFHVRIRIGENKFLIPLVAYIDKASCLLFSCLVGEMDEETILAMKHKVADLLQNTNVKEIIIEVLMASEIYKGTSNTKNIQFYLLDNLTRLLDLHVRIHLNGPSEKLQDKLKFLKTYLAELPHELRLEKFNYIMKSIEHITFKAIPILYSCYDKDLKEDMAMEVNGALSKVIQQIEDIQTEVKVIALHSYPEIDGLGFVDLLLEHLGELLNFRPGLIEDMKSQIETLHADFDSLRKFLKKIKKLRNEFKELGDLWKNITGLAHQVEYIIDFYLVTPDSRVMLSLTKIIEQTELIRSKVSTIYDEEKYHRQAFNIAKTSNCVSSQAIGLTADEVVGFEDEAEKIMECLVRGTKQRDVVSIVGLPGLGKTTLTRKMYGDPLLIEHFDVRAWCTVSQTYWKRELLLSILGDIIVITKEINELNDEELAAKLYQCLKGRRYLIVIDDLWHIEAWDALARSFPDDKINSRILVTTRLQNVASHINSKVHLLRQLFEDESWQLFQKKVFQEESLSQEILDVGKQIAESCKGLPLAIVVIAGVLAKMEKSAFKWKQIEQNLSSHVFNDSESHCKAILELSYDHLPDYLKSCFLYFGAFKEDEEIPLWKLKWLWIAEGFVRNSGAKSLEDAAEEYLMDLISRSLVTSTKERSSGGVKACRVHDLLRDFCLEKAKEESFLQVIDVNGGSEYSGSYDQRRLGIHLEIDHDEMAKLVRYSVRSLLYSADGWGLSFILENFKLLKVLDIGNIFVYKYPREIELLIHLRYLAMGTRLTFIPSSISNLWNLQSLLVNVVSYSHDKRVDVPNSLLDMVNLRHVHIKYSASFDVHANALENSLLLENLQTLSTLWFSCRADAENLLRRVPKLQKLRCIFDRCWDDYSERHQFPVLDVLDQLMSLKVRFKNISPSKENFEWKFPSNLQKLTLTEFPGKWDEISLIGKTLPNLKVLKLYGNDLIDNWNVDDGDFPKLKYLKLSCDIREWNASDDSFPILEKLVLDECWMLNEIPSCFGGIPTLQMITVNKCGSSVDDSARRIQKEQEEEWQNYELKVNITSIYRSQ